MRMRRDGIIENFYVVDINTGCWNWIGGLNDAGYAYFRHHGKLRKALHVLYERLIGPIPEGLVLDHNCRNRKCVNPEHATPRTNKDNVRLGDSAKLDIEKVKEIKLKIPHMTQQHIAEEYGVSQYAISKIKRGLTWSEV